jgi:hypothetical protein
MRVLELQTKITIFVALLLGTTFGCSKQDGASESGRQREAVKANDNDHDRDRGKGRDRRRDKDRDEHPKEKARFAANSEKSCRNLIDSGCMALGDAGFVDASDSLGVCLHLIEVQTRAVAEELEELAERLDGGKEPSRADVAAQMAQCIELAADCPARSRCLEGNFRPSWSLDGGLVPPGFEAGLPPPPPPWAPPWTGPGTPGWTDVPWDSGVRVITGVDSPACVKCAIERCPTMAYYCFGASGNATHCPGGDCCQEMRTCIETCGGYQPGASPAEFYECMDRCSMGRPHAPQQLANLQNCGDIACAGCQTRDTHSTNGPDGGLRPVPPPPANPLHPRLTCVAQEANKNYVAIFGYRNDSATIINVPVANDNKFSSAPINRNQPTTFLPGAQARAFAVSFDGRKITWMLNGRTASASVDSPRCDANGDRVDGGHRPDDDCGDDDDDKDRDHGKDRDHDKDRDRGDKNRDWR